MFYIIQENMFREEGFERLLEFYAADIQKLIMALEEAFN
jgi:hypothetical protein